MHNVVSFLYYTAGSCIFNDDLDSILYVPLLIVYSVGSGVVSPKTLQFRKSQTKMEVTPISKQRMVIVSRIPSRRRTGGHWLTGSSCLWKRSEVGSHHRQGR